jgi:hypothetical protein
MEIMFRKYAVVAGLGLILAASCGALGASWNRPDRVVPVNDAAADEVGGGQAYCTPHYLDGPIGCNLIGCLDNYCSPIYYRSDSGTPINAGCYIPGGITCYVCGVYCCSCDCVTPCVGTSGL